MHQPLIPAWGPELRTARLIGNLQHMLEHQDVGDNHNALVFLRCYRRMGGSCRGLRNEGWQPRVMLEYSGTLLHGLRQMGASEVIDVKSASSDVPASGDRCHRCPYTQQGRARAPLCAAEFPGLRDPSIRAPDGVADVTRVVDGWSEAG
jgi:hypothetical protein